MNHEQNIAKLIDDLNADKSIPQPYKNYLVSDAKRLQMALRGAKTYTAAKPPPDVSASAECSCKAGTKADVNCPQHGLHL